MYAKFRQTVTCLHGVVFRDAGSPWVFSLLMCVTGFWCPPEFCGRNLECGSWIALLCVCLDSSFGRHSRVAYVLCVLWSRCSWCFGTVSSFLEVSFMSFVVHMVSWIGILWGVFELRFLGLGFRIFVQTSAWGKSCNLQTTLRRSKCSTKFWRVFPAF